jgi:4-alpha-glucanotransferase
MKIFQFAFDSGPDNPYLPHNFINNSVVYTGNHDNNTIRGWYENLGKDIKLFVDDYTGFKGGEINWEIIRLAWSSKAAYAITPLQDILGLGSEARMNTPGTSAGNWRWRFRKGALGSEIKSRLARYNYIFGR